MGSSQARNDQAGLLQLLLIAGAKGGSIPPIRLASSGDRHRTTEQLMAIRKNLAKTLINAAKAVESDQSKERIQKWVRDSRVKIAKAIEPKD